MEKRKGHYLGTEVEGKWWKRYRGEGFFARGNGEWWFDSEWLYFRRYLTNEPLKLRLERISSMTIGKWHSGRWEGGIPIIKMAWEKDTLKLNSGFVLTRKKDEAIRLIDQLLKR